MPRWVGSSTTGHWVDDNGNPVAGAYDNNKAAPAAPPPSAGAGGDPFHNPNGASGGGGYSDPFHNSNDWNGGTGGGSGTGSGTPSHGWDWYAQNELNEFGQQMSEGYEGWKAKSQSYFDPYSQYAQGLGANSPSQNQDYYAAHRNDTGPSRESDLYDAQKGSAGPSQSRDAYRGMQDAYQNGPQYLRDAYNSQAGYFASPTNMDSYSAQMKDYGGHASDTSQRYDQRMGTSSPDYEANRYRDRMNDAGPSSAKDLLGTLGSQKSAAEGLMVDPTHTQAIGDLYSNVLMPQESGPGYAEQWYMDTANHDNPYYDRLADKTSQAAERRAAASGTFNAGRSQRMQDEALTDLRAQQFKDQGALASAADASKDSRLAGLTTGAKTWEDTVLGNRKYNLDVASQMDTSRAGLDKIRADLAGTADSTDLRHAEDIDSLAKGSSDEYSRQQESLDKLATDSDSAEFNRRKLTTDYLHGQDDVTASKYRDQIGASGTLDRENQTRQTDLAGQANQASGEEQRNRDYLDQMARGADSTEAGNRKFMSDIADRASKEGGSNLDRQGTALLADAAARAGIDLDYNTMEAGTLTTAQLGKIQIELAKAGMDAAEVQALIGGFTDFLGKITGGVLSRPRKA